MAKFSLLPRTPFMKKVVTNLASLVLLLVVFYMFSPQIVEILIDSECSQSELSEACLNRMRAAGHLQSQRGNLTKAKIWYQRAAEHGDPSAMFHLAWGQEELAQALLEKALRAELVGQKDHQSNYEADNAWISARSWYQQSAGKGFAPSMNNLGQLELFGLGGPEDPFEAYRWHLAAAEAGNPVAHQNVALAHIAGQGVAQDQAEGKRWSIWTPSQGLTADFAEPTLGRTKFFGSVNPIVYRSRMRTAAELGKPIQSTISDIKPNSALPSFQDVLKKMRNQDP